MDWSLVLASQGIETTILRDSPAHRWNLIVSPSEFNRALAAIKQYRLENSGWSWRRQVPGANLQIHAGAILWCLYLVLFYIITTLVHPDLSRLGVMNNVAVSHGAWWRLFTSILLHADLAHLFANIVFGSLFLGLAMARFGPGIALLFSFLAGGAGNLFGFFIYLREYNGVGSSGMMMGALGLLCVHSFSLWRSNPKAAKYVLSGVISGIFIFILFGLTPGTDILAHAGGFIAGAFFGLLLSFIPEPKLQNKILNFGALFVLACLIGATWTLLLR